MKPVKQIDWSDWEHVYCSADPCEGERHLLLAVLERAIRDALGVKFGSEKHDVGNHRPRAARLWLGLGEPYCMALNPEPFSFHWICYHLRINGEYIHGQLTKALSTPGTTNELLERLYARTLNRSFRLFELQNKMGARKSKR